MDRAKTIAVIGAGNGGFNLVAHLGAAGRGMRPISPPYGIIFSPQSL